MATESTPLAMAEPEVVEKEGKIKKAREYWVDWFRMVSIWLIVSYHFVQSLERLQLFEWDTLHTYIQPYQRGMRQTGIPVFMYLSGVAAALCPATPLLYVLARRGLRLLLPCVAGFFLAVLPCQFLARAFRPGVPKTPNSFWEWVPVYFESCRNAGCIEWLWFLVVLFVLQTLHAPLFAYTRSRVTARRTEREVPRWGTFWTRFRPHWDAGCDSIVYVLVAAVTVGLAVLFARRHELNHSLINAWLAFYVGTVIFTEWIAATPHGGQRELQWLVLGAGAVACSMVMCQHLTMEGVEPLANRVSSCMFFSVFYVLGHFCRLLEQFQGECAAAESRFALFREMPTAARASVNLLVQPVALFAVLVLVALCLPTYSSSEFALKPVEEYMLSYPTYEEPLYAQRFVLGTFCWLALLVPCCRALMNASIHPWLHFHAGQAVMVIYVFHWLAIDGLLAYFIAPSYRWRHCAWEEDNCICSGIVRFGSGTTFSHQMTGASDVTVCEAKWFPEVTPIAHHLLKYQPQCDCSRTHEALGWHIAAVALASIVLLHLGYALLVSTPLRHLFGLQTFPSPKAELESEAQSEAQSESQQRQSV